MKQIKKTIILLLLVVGLSLSGASAKIIFTGDEIRDPAGSYGYTDFVGDFYVEPDVFYTDSEATNVWATDTETFPYPDSLDLWYRGHVSTGAYAKWTDRTNADYGFIEGDIFEGYDSTTSAVLPQITMTVAGLDAEKIYDVYLVYWSRESTWSTLAAFSGEPLQAYNAVNADVTFHTYAEVTFACEVKLGQVTGVDQVSVDISDSGAGGDYRSRVDG
ncbi:MAG: hypothetical protein JW709_12815, partial [Sedimentisphaerales bacterium]|nr:hypothetical protein [Sedimentisphaerales bacterium]